MIINDPNENKIKRIVNQLIKELGPLSESDEYSYTKKDIYGGRNPVSTWEELARYVHNPRGAYSATGTFDLDEEMRSLNEYNLQGAVSKGGGFDLPVLSALVNMLAKGASSIKNRINPPKRQVEGMTPEMLNWINERYKK